MRYRGGGGKVKAIEHLTRAIKQNEFYLFQGHKQRFANTRKTLF